VRGKATVARTVAQQPRSVIRERHLGNFPQAFSHLALVEAASRIVLAARLAVING
jgi:hypothetical protein